jgi:hypothetical protein
MTSATRAVLMLGLWLGACSDSADAGGGGAGAGGAGAGGAASGGAPTTGGSGGAQACEAVLTSNFFSQHCVDCVEDACCPTAAACADDALCMACLDDTATEGCDTNAPLLDLLSCVFSAPACLEACGCLECGCIDDGVCDAGFMGFEVCSCPDCMTAPVPACQGACVIDGVCDDTDTCTCVDCDTLAGCSCNLDGFCDTYHEHCACADCAMRPECLERP